MPTVICELSLECQIVEELANGSRCDLRELKQIVAETINKIAKAGIRHLKPSEHFNTAAFRRPTTGIEVEVPVAVAELFYDVADQYGKSGSSLVNEALRKKLSDYNGR